jgi:predicted Zn-dependent peptidase
MASTPGITGYPAPPSLLSSGPLYSPPAQNTTLRYSNVNPPAEVILANGAKAVLQQRGQSARSHFELILPIGPNLNGPRTLLPRLLVAGSPRTKGLLEQAGRQGIQTTVSAKGDVLTLQLSAPAQAEQAMLDLAMRMVFQPDIDPKTFQAEREDLLKGFAQEQALPEVRLSDMVTRELYGADHPYAETHDRLTRQLQVQTPTTVLNVLSRAVAQPAQVKLHWISAQPVGVQQQQLDNILKRYSWSGNYVLPALPQSPAVRYMPRKPLLLLPDDSLQRAHLQVAWRAPNVNDADYPTFLVLLNLLDGFNGRFFQQLRTRQGLVYSTQQRYENYRQAAEFRVITEVDFDKVSDALAGVNKVIAGDLETPGLLSHLVTERELTRAKKSFILNTRDTIQSADGLADFNQPSVLLEQLPPLPNQLIDQINAVTAMDVYRIAQRVFGPGNACITGITAPARVLANLPAAKATQTSH